MPEVIALPLRQVRRGIFPALMLLLLASLAVYALVMEMFGDGNAVEQATRNTPNVLRS
jgi:hypothetical protein